MVITRTTTTEETFGHHIITTWSFMSSWCDHVIISSINNHQLDLRIKRESLLLSKLVFLSLYLLLSFLAFSSFKNGFLFNLYGCWGEYFILYINSYSTLFTTQKLSIAFDLLSLSINLEICDISVHVFLYCCW